MLSYLSKKGFSVIEMVIVASIMLILLTIVFTNYRSGQQQLALDRSVHKLAQDIRKSLGMTMSAQECSTCSVPGVPPGYGIYIETSFRGHYILYADTGPSETGRKYTGEDTTLEIIGLERDIEIDSLSSGGNSVDSVSINFSPPDPIVDISGGSIAVITLKIAGTTRTKAVRVNSVGLVSIESPQPQPTPLCGEIDGVCPAGCIRLQDQDCTYCGDDRVQAPNDENINEVCDGIDKKGESCESQELDPGVLRCSSDCLSFDTSSCGDIGFGTIFSCADYTDETSCNNNTRHVGKCLWYENQCITLPDYCPVVYVDENRNIVVDEEPYFPIGFWAFYFGPPTTGWSNYEPPFDAIVDGPRDDHENIGRDNIKLFAQLSGNSGKVETNKMNTAIIAWELFHEPSAGTTSGEIMTMADAVRSIDPCKRPVFVTPTMGDIAAGYLQGIQDITDMTMIQAGYRVPMLPLKGTGDAMKKGVADMGDKPALFVMRVEGYQEERYRLAFREPTLKEMRVQAYDAIINGAKGVLFFSFDKGRGDTGTYGFKELNNSGYDIEDSPEHYQDMKSLGDDLKSNTSLFLSPFSPSISVSSGNDDIRCGVFDVPEGDAITHYLICANVAQEHSPYFDFASGSRTWRIRAHALGSGNEVFPQYTCGDGKDNDGDGMIDTNDPDCITADDSEYGATHPRRFRDRELNPNLVAIQDISTGITNEDTIIDRVQIYFGGSLEGAQFRYAIYSDELRDFAPDTPHLVSEWLAVPTEPGLYEFALRESVVLEHTKKYFLLIKTNKEGVLIQEKDVRNGARVKDSTPDNPSSYVPISEFIPLGENVSYSELHKEKKISDVTISLNRSFNRCKVKKMISGNFSSCGTFSGSRITDTFDGYAVHIYRLE